MTAPGRSVLLVAHTERRQICEEATRAAGQLVSAGIGVRMLADEAAHVDVEGVVAADLEHAVRQTVAEGPQ